MKLKLTNEIVNMNFYTPKPTHRLPQKKSNVKYMLTGLVVGTVFWGLLALSIAAFG